MQLTVDETNLVLPEYSVTSLLDVDLARRRVRALVSIEVVVLLPLKLIAGGKQLVRTHTMVCARLQRVGSSIELPVRAEVHEVVAKASWAVLKRTIRVNALVCDAVRAVRSQLVLQDQCARQE